MAGSIRYPMCSKCGKNESKETLAKGHPHVCNKEEKDWWTKASVDERKTKIATK